jgi:hypothetical protein
MNFDLTTPPSWAPTWCYVYFIAALLGAVSAVVALVIGYKKMSGFGMFALLFLGTLAFVDSMMYFWICRASLAK